MSIEEAWSLVIKWLDSFNKNHSYLTEEGVIALNDGDDLSEL